MWSDKQVSVTRLEYKSLYICYGCHTLAQPHSSRGTRRRRKGGRRCNLLAQTLARAFRQNALDNLSGIINRNLQTPVFPP